MVCARIKAAITAAIVGNRPIKAILDASNLIGSTQQVNKQRSTRKFENPYYSDISRPFDKPKSGRIAVKVINQLGDEVMSQK